MIHESLTNVQQCMHRLTMMVLASFVSELKESKTIKNIQTVVRDITPAGTNIFPSRNTFQDELSISKGRSLEG